MLSPVTSIAGTPLVIAPIMATSRAGECSAAASTSGRTPPACWSPRHATAACAEVLQRRAFTRLGRGLAPGGAIPAARIAETASVVAEQHALAEQVGARTIRAVATAVIRRAANRDEFCAAIREHGGVDVCVLDGEEEARLAFLGATRTLGRPLPGRVAVVDVGGGSTEIAVGTLDGGVEWCALVRVRLGLPGRRLPGRRPAVAGRARRRSARTPPDALHGDRARRRSTPRSPSAAARPRCGGSSATSSTPTACARALRVLTQRSGRGRRRSASTSTSSACG